MLLDCKNQITHLIYSFCLSFFSSQSVLSQQGHVIILNVVANCDDNRLQSIIVKILLDSKKWSPQRCTCSLCRKRGPTPVLSFKDYSLMFLTSLFSRRLPWYLLIIDALAVSTNLTGNLYPGEEEEEEEGVPRSTVLSRWHRYQFWPQTYILLL